MRRLEWLACLLAVAAMAAIGCTPKATGEECTAACKNYAELQAKAAPGPSLDEQSAQIEANYKQKTDEFAAQQAQELAAIDQEYQGKLAAAPEAEKAAITEQYEAAKNAKLQEFAGRTQTLEQQRTQELMGIEQRRAQAQAEKDKAVNDCTAKCLQSGTKKPKADCQATATTLEAYNACK